MGSLKQLADLTEYEGERHQHAPSTALWWGSTLNTQLRELADRELSIKSKKDHQSLNAELTFRLAPRAGLFPAPHQEEQADHYSNTEGPVTAASLRGNA